MRRIRKKDFRNENMYAKDLTKEEERELRKQFPKRGKIKMKGRRSNEL